MRRKAYVWAGLATGMGLAMGLGCHHDKYGLNPTLKEEVVLPPDEPRFNNPPTEIWKPSKKANGTTPAGGGSGGSGGAGGMGGMGGPNGGNGKMGPPPGSN